MYRYMHVYIHVYIYMAQRGLAQPHAPTEQSSIS